ncbi:MAG: hypothetical protein EA351_13475 [Gemmatimonadales bacterium]|nr:MAG: hypothetical protein EA351_13475 [Gemmatimonadales bacterium]
MRCTTARIRVGALLLLPLFVVQTGDGLAAYDCHGEPPVHQVHHDGMDHGGHDHDPDHGSDHRSDPDSDHDSGHGSDHDPGQDCPMGHAEGLACAGGVTAPSLVQAAPTMGAVERAPRIRGPDAFAGILRSHELFRPPRI